MCSPLVPTITKMASEGASAVSSGIQTRQQAKYSAKIAETNAKIAIDKGQQEQQTGIEKAREEKLKGIQNANFEKAQNASNGFDINSVTNLYNYEDTYKTSESNAKDIQDSYNTKAQEYFTQANSYLSSSENILKNYNSNLMNKALGATSKVTSAWKDSVGTKEEKGKI